MKHQDLALRAASSAPASPCPDDAFAFLMDYGTGKSQVVLDEWGEMATSGGPQDLLLVAPKGSYRNWFQDKSDLQVAEIRHMDPMFQERMVVQHWSAGGGKEHRDRLNRFLRVRDRPRALFVNVESLSQPGKARDLIEEFVVQGRGVYGAIDESTAIKGRKSKRTKFLMALGESMVVRRIATGLLTPKGPTDIYAQFAFLSERIVGCRSWQSFERRYCKMKPMKIVIRGRERWIEVIDSYCELDDLQARIAPYSFRVLKSECLDLEEKKYVLWETEHTPEQAKLYAEVRDNAAAELEGGDFVSTQSVMTKIMRLHQINCGHVTDENGETHDILSNRERDIVEMLGVHRGKVVIWTPFRRPIPKIRAAIEKEFGPGHVAEFHGGNVSTRSAEERRFLGDPECRFMIATQGAAGRGNTWVNADLEIYHSNNDDLEQRYNSEDRLHRKGQINRVTVADVIVPDTVDMKIVRNLRKKITMATTLTGEEAREWLI